MHTQIGCAEKNKTMTEQSALITNGSVATVAVAFLKTAVLRMIPYSVPALALIALDLLYGVRAARHRGEKIRVSKGLRQSVTKVFTYVIWLVLASTLALAFNKEWLEWGTLGLVYANELASVIGNYLETKGIELSMVDLYRLIVRKGAEKVGVEIGKEDAEGIIKPKEDKPRNAKGQFTSKK